MMKALDCLYIAVEKSVADDVRQKVLARVRELEKSSDDLCGGCSDEVQALKAERDTLKAERDALQRTITDANYVRVQLRTLT
jgi:hypothetical protein